VPGLLDDLIANLGRDDIAALEQAAVAYGQLEFVHPFLDGNRRVGRCLMQVIAHRRGLVEAAAPLVGGQRSPDQTGHSARTASIVGCGI
jgi:Fic family protein